MNQQRARLNFTLMGYAVYRDIDCLFHSNTSRAALERFLCKTGPREKSRTAELLKQKPQDILNGWPRFG
jgi:hypothetical protein